MKTRVSIQTKNLNTEARQRKAKEVAGEMYKIINSPEFKELIMTMSTGWRVGEFSNFQQWTNEDLYQLIMSGDEEWNDEIDHELDLIVDDYYSRKSVIGYMNPGKPKIWVNTRYFDTASNKAVGSNFLHEYGHTLGFRHGGRHYRKSLAYYMNQAYEACHSILIDGKEPPNGYWRCKRIWWKPWRKRCWWVAV